MKIELSLGPHFQGGPNRSYDDMCAALARFREFGGLPGEAALVLSQLLLNMAGHGGRALTQELISQFFDAADVTIFMPGQES